MTNQQQILLDLADMSAQELDDTLGRGNSLYTDLTVMVCEDCTARSGGRCPNADEHGNIPDNPPCPEVAEWLSWECEREKVLGK